jgi:long-chain acyl-CoA synthetase
VTDAAPHPWLSAYPDGVDWHAALTAKPLYQLFDKAAAQFPDRPYIDFQGKVYTYGQLSGLVDRAAAGFRKLGVQKGTTVGLYLPNCPFYLISFFGILKAGGTVVNFSPLYSEPELENQAQDSGVEMMVALSLKELYPRINAVLDNTHIHRLIVADLAEAIATAT